jgi:hypothetical protein
MYELLDRNVCWVGAMNDEDARGMLEQAFHAMNNWPTEAESNAILRLSGNFPALLQLLTYWWSNTSTKPGIADWATTLLAENNIRRRLMKMWNGLTQEEQFILSEIVGLQSRSSEGSGTTQGPQSINKVSGQQHQNLLTRLTRKGVCEHTTAGWRVRGDLFLAYVKEVGTTSRGRIWLNRETQEINQGLARIEDLTPLERRVLQYFIMQPYQPHENEELINYVWEDKALDMVDNDLQQLIYRLRKKIDLNPPQYIITWKGRPGGYQFYPEGRPK